MEEIPHGACYILEPVVRVRGREELSQSCPASRVCAGQSGKEKAAIPLGEGGRALHAAGFQVSCWVQRPVGAFGRSLWLLAQHHQGTAERWVGAEKNQSAFCFSHSSAVTPFSALYLRSVALL